MNTQTRLLARSLTHSLTPTCQPVVSQSLPAAVETELAVLLSV